MDQKHFIDRIKADLENDVLDYGWVCQIANTIWPEADAKTISIKVYKAVMKLLDTEEVIVGDSVVDNDLVEIKQWDGGLDEISQKLKSTIQKADLDEVGDFYFWLQRKSRSN